MKDYLAVAKDYAKEAIRDKRGKKHGLLLRQAAQRFIDDLKRAKSRTPPFIFDEWHAADVCDFIEKLPHVEGEWGSDTLVLIPAQAFFLVQLFGFRKRPEHGKASEQFLARRYSSALYNVARKNGKSVIAADILLYCLCCEPEAGAQVITAATTFDQARIIFDDAAKVVRKTTALRMHFGLEPWSKSISRPSTGASFKPIHAKASTQDGLNPSHTAFDEVHAHKSPDLLNVLKSAAGARTNPLWLYTTTEGYPNAGPWSEIKKFAKTLLAGGIGTSADHFLAVIFAMDDTDEPTDERKWIKANPLMDANPALLDNIRSQLVEAKQMPSQMAEFRIKRCNLPSASALSWINLAKWNACAGPVDIEQLREWPCFGGLDLSSTQDIAAFRLVWFMDDIIYTHGIAWCPAGSVQYRNERGTVPYQSWVESGYLRQTPGEIVDYGIIERDILALVQGLRLEQIAYDRWNATDLCNRLADQGLPLIEFVQGPKSYHPAMQFLERHYMAGNLRHGGNPLLTWCASNLIPRYDVNMNSAPDRKSSSDKIDDMVALLMAVGVAAARQPREPEYQLIAL